MHSLSLSGVRPIAYNKVTCVGRENAISNCRHDNQATPCDLSHVASAVCSNKTIPSIELRLLGNGASPREGLLQVYFANEWGIVCASGWSLASAHVVCQHLKEGVAISTFGMVRPGDNLFWLSGVRCYGNETLLSECQHLGWGYAAESCYHGNMSVWVKCSGNGESY